MNKIIFWCEIVSPHMLGLMYEMMGLGYDVKVMTNEIISGDRAAMGWSIEGLGVVKIEQFDILSDANLLMAKGALNICSGIRGNGVVGDVQRKFLNRGIKFFVVMERIFSQGVMGFFKRILYKKIFLKYEPVLLGVLSIGEGSRQWLNGVGVGDGKIFNFAYFLPGTLSDCKLEYGSGQVRVIFVGQLIKRKRVEWFLQAVSGLQRELGPNCFNITIVGGGEEAESLKKIAANEIYCKVCWVDFVSIGEVRKYMANADCLVLPSVHDGWGAVAAEAMIEGTPVLCSDACGVAEIVSASGFGGVFRVQSKTDLKNKLREVHSRGCFVLNDRRRLMQWSECLVSGSGAKYLDEIIRWNFEGGGNRPIPPWLRG